MWMLKDKKTGEVIDPRSADFALSPNDVMPGATDWDDVLGAEQETDIVEGFETLWQEPTTIYVCGNDERPTITRQRRVTFHFKTGPTAARRAWCCYAVITQRQK